MDCKALIVLAGLALAGCGSNLLQPTNTATMPHNPYGGPVMNQTEAIALSSWALKDPANTAGNPERAARAIAAEDWLAGQTILYGNYNGWAPNGQVSWSMFREQVRAAIGVAPDASSQDLVNRLLAAADALKAGKPDTAKAQLSAPIFTRGPDATLAALTNLPALSYRDWAFADMNRNTNRSTGVNPIPMLR